MSIRDRYNYLNNAKCAVAQLKATAQGPDFIANPTATCYGLHKLDADERKALSDAYANWYRSWVAPAVATLDRKLNKAN